jgi:hypothetical protein
MKYSLMIPLFLVVACGGEDNKTGTLQITLNRVGDPANLVSTANGKNFPIVINEGEVSFAAINLVDTDAGEEETPSFEGITTFDFFAQPNIVLGPITVVPVSFEEIHVIPADAVVGPQVGKSLHLGLTVTLSDNTTAQATIDLTFGAAGAEENKLPVALDVAIGDTDNVTINLDLAALLSEIDFDTLAAAVGDNIAIQDNTGSAVIDDAIARMVENVFTVAFFLEGE